MRLRKSEIGLKVNNNLSIKFINQDLTSYAGLELLNRFFRHIKLNSRIKNVMKQFKIKGDYPGYKLIMLLICIIILGIERVSQIKYLQDDPLLKRLCELKKISSRQTILKFLKSFTDEVLKGLAELNSELITDYLQKLGLTTLTIDIDGTVISSRGKPELSAKGYNNIKRGAYSYFPLTAYLAQTGHFLKIMNRPGNVHDSNGSTEFIKEIVLNLKFMLGSKIRIQVRHDAGFFDEKRFKMYETEGVEYCSKVPFWRYPIFKNTILSKNKWEKINSKTSYFFKKMKLDNWEKERLFLIIRIEKPKKERKNDYQLNLFEPDDRSYEYSGICTNMNLSAKYLFKFMLGRSAQEKAIGELKNDFNFDKIPSNSYMANSGYQQLSMLSYNLMTSFQLNALGYDKTFKRNFKKTRHFVNCGIKTLRFLIFYKAGIFTNSSGKTVLNISNNSATKNLYEKIMENLPKTA